MRRYKPQPAPPMATRGALHQTRWVRNRDDVQVLVQLPAVLKLRLDEPIKSDDRLVLIDQKRRRTWSITYTGLHHYYTSLDELHEEEPLGALGPN